jgi:hypothetical protein
MLRLCLSASALLLLACASRESTVHVHFHQEKFSVKAFEGKTLAVSVAPTLEVDERILAKAGVDAGFEAAKLRGRFMESLVETYPGAKAIEADPAHAELFAGFHSEANPKAQKVPAPSKAAADAVFASIDADYLLCLNLARYGVSRIPKGSTRPPPVSLGPQGITFTIPLGPEGTVYEEHLNLYANLEVWEKKSRRKKLSLIAGTHGKPSGDDYKDFLDEAPGDVVARLSEYLKEGVLPKED